MDYIKKELAIRALKESQNHLEKNTQFVKAIGIAGLVIAGLYFSKYFINAASETIRACKNLKRAVKE